MTTPSKLLVISLVIAVLGIVVYWIRFQLRLRAHNGIDRQFFIEHFARLGVAHDIAGAVYDHYRGVAVWRSFRVSPNDDLEGVFGHAPEEMDSSLDAILSELRLSPPPASILRDQNRTLTTVADVVDFVAWIGKHQGVRP